MVICPACGAENGRGARFCASCGTPLSVTESAGQRKMVTLLFCDLQDSTGLAQRLDPEALRVVMDRYFRVVRAAVERHGGVVEKFVGDAVMAAFGIPAAHEDDAARAVRAAAEARAGLVAAGDGLVARFGINTGRVLVANAGSGQAFATGEPVVVAARLEQAALPGQVLMSAATYALLGDAVCVDPVGPVALKGRADPVEAYALVDVAAGGARPGRRTSPFVGRRREVRRLVDLFAAAEDEREVQLVLLFGPAGVGKSRLTAEFVATVGDRARVIEGRALPYGEGIGYWPLFELAAGVAGFAGDDDDATRLAKLRAALADQPDGDRIADGVGRLIGLDCGADVAPGPWAVRRMLEATAAHGPLIVLLDDLHWADDEFLASIGAALDRLRDVPVMVVSQARPELLDRGTALGDGRVDTTTIHLGPLRDGEARTLAAGLLDDGDDQLVGRVAAASEGNPLYVEELAAMYRSGETMATVPPTVEGLLSARLDGLPPRERSVIERAAVEGKLFHSGGVAAMAGDGDDTEVRGVLDALAERDLVRAVEGDDGAYRFRHLLIRDVAYEAIPKAVRARMHERLEGWLEERGGTPDEILGHHLEQSVLLRRELDPAATVDGLAVRAAARLRAAGLKALGAGARGDAAVLLTRARTLAPDDPETIASLPALGTALQWDAGFAEAEEVFSDAIRQAVATADEATEWRARLDLTFARLGADPSALDMDAVVAEARAAVDVFERLDHPQGLSRAWYQLAYLGDYAGTGVDAVACAERALEAALRAGDRHRVRNATGILGHALLDGPTPVDEAIERLEQLISGERARGEVDVREDLAQLEAMRMRFDVARDWLQQARTMTVDAGDPWGALWTTAIVDRLSGDLPSAEAALVSVCRRREQLRAESQLSTAEAQLAQVVYLQGREDEAGDIAARAERRASVTDLATQVPARGVRAKVLARAGSLATAEGLARQVVEMAGLGSAVSLRASALADLGDVLDLAGRPAEAATARERARAIHQAKGNLAAARLLAAPAAAMPAPG
jgi:class 3 adenylate cyclase/tetratricopeptide (TPR) repeat protein